MSASTSDQDENSGLFFFLGPSDVGFAIIFIRVNCFEYQDETIVLYLAVATASQVGLGLVQVDNCPKTKFRKYCK